MASNNITLDTTGAAGNKGKNVIASTVVALAAYAFLGVLAHELVVAYDRRTHPDTTQTPVLVSSDAQYQPFSGELNLHEIPWLFDGEQRKSGKILAIWSAKSERNASACNSEWEKKSGYPTLCKSLADQVILAVHLDDINPPLVAYVPVSRIALVETGQKVLIKMGRITGDGVVHALPEYLRAL